MSAAGARSSRPEVWGGAECSTVRVGDAFHDAIRRTGHDRREDDVARIASLGVTAVRAPVLWERTAPDPVVGPDWSWADAHLSALRARSVRAIVGLVHHGSGPRHTDLLDPEFPAKLAVYARAVARRYPWVRDFTPINEPLTTARFSALYGHWYPHARDPRAFCRALLNQCLAIQRAMDAIREVTPRARLVQTEDFARVGGTPKVAYQAAFENERRWLSLDLLCGFVDRGHALYPYLRDHGVSDEDLAPLAARPCVPDVVGVNYYVTSERWLDERLDRYPPAFAATNGRDAYVDIEAARAAPDPIWGHAGALEATWGRYGRPVAITETHLGGTPEEQLRWWDEAWRAALESRRRGVDVRAVTAWALFGSYDWDSLLVEERGHYEPGAFDVRASPPKATALARDIRACAKGASVDHPVLDVPGWWRRASRYTYFGPKVSAPARPLASRSIVLAGADSPLARALEEACGARGLPCVRRESANARAAGGEHAWAVVDVAGHEASDGADLATRANAILDALVHGWGDDASAEVRSA